MYFVSSIVKEKECILDFRGKKGFKNYIYVKIRIRMCNFQVSRKWKEVKKIINAVNISKEENKQTNKKCMVIKFEVRP